MRRPDSAMLLTGWRLVRVPLILIVAYLALRETLSALSARHGLGSPDGLGLGYLAVTVLTEGLRLILLIVVPAVVAYRVVAYAVSRLPHRSAAPAVPVAPEFGEREVTEPTR
ncbi:hypothetical protein ACFXHA_29710 [Nocardia sp. NPDC059240]|uniref:hypothetical protein n=1 Tax=Nocardia sp. NPDC059240 TaxID=3346786 RepID=UPI00368A4484